MALEQFIESIGELKPEREYWLVRTDSGQFYDTFIEGNYIGIGWNKITIENLTRLTDISTKDLIAQRYNYNLEQPRGKNNVTSIYNKLKRFKDLKKGDVVLIPSHSSYRFAFGIIEDNHIYSDPDNRDLCPYYKRRKVNWVVQKKMIELDPIFYKIRQSRHAISSISKHQNPIDNILNSLYIKHGYGHYVIDITTTEDININSLLMMVGGIQELISKINDYFDLSEDIDSSSIKLNLQSPGKIEFKLKSGKSLMILAAILSMTCCANPAETSQSKIEINGIAEFSDINKSAIKNTQKAFDELKVDMDKINSFQ